MYCTVRARFVDVFRFLGALRLCAGGAGFLGLFFRGVGLRVASNYGVVFIGRGMFAVDVLAFAAFSVIRFYSRFSVEVGALRGRDSIITIFEGGGLTLYFFTFSLDARVLGCVSVELECDVLSILEHYVLSILYDDDLSIKVILLLYDGFFVPTNVTLGAYGFDGGFIMFNFRLLLCTFIEVVGGVVSTLLFDLGPSELRSMRVSTSVPFCYYALGYIQSATLSEFGVNVFDSIEFLGPLFTFLIGG